MSVAATLTDERTIFTVTNLKQYTYCARVVYYTYCLPILRPQTFKMQASHRAHEREAVRERRRSLRWYGLPEGERLFDVRLESAALGLRGRADMVIRTEDEVIPVDHKLTRRKTGPHLRLQITTYGMMLAESGDLAVRRGFVYAMALRQAEEIRMTAQGCAKVRRLAGAMREMVEHETMPDPPRGRGRCVSCEFRRFCNDL